MREAVIVSTARTPIGRAYRGAFNDTQAQQLGAHAVRHAVQRAGVDPAEIEDVVMGAALQQGSTGTNVARQIALAAGLPWRMDTSGQYVGALLYLAIPGSVIAFTAYLNLVGRLGPEKAAYATVLFPIVALNISALAEGYQWTPLGIAGLVLVMAGNLLVFRPPRWLQAKAQTLQKT